MLDADKQNFYTKKKLSNQKTEVFTNCKNHPFKITQKEKVNKAIPDVSLKIK